MQSQYRIMKAAAGQIDAIKIGFNWSVFFRIYIAMQILFIVVWINTGFVAGQLLMASLVSGVIVGGSLGCIPGYLWNKLKHRKLLRSQFTEAGIVTAGNSEAAVALFNQSSKS